MSANKDESQNNVPDQGGVGFTKDESGSTRQGAGQANQQKGDPGQDAGKANGGAWRSDVPDQSGVGFLPQDGGGDRQGSGPGSRQATSGIQSNFAHASPESMVNPAGAPQSGAGSIAGKAAGEIPGGVASQIQASRDQQLHQDAPAQGGVPGTPADDGRYGVSSSGGNNMERSDS